MYIYETHVGEEMGWWFLIYSFNTLQQNPEDTTLSEFDHISSSSKFLFGGHLETSFCGDTWHHHTSPRCNYRFGAMSLRTLKINEQNGRCVRKGWVKGIEVTIAHTRSGGAPEPKLEKDLWLRGIPSTWSSQGFYEFQRLRWTGTSRGSWKMF